MQQVGSEIHYVAAASDEQGPWLPFFWAVMLGCAFLYWLNTDLHLDDAYVYLRVGENMAHTGAPVFNQGDAFNITTSPIWMLVTSLLAVVSSPETLPALCKAAFVASLMAASWMLSRLAKPHSLLLSVLAPFPVFFSASMPTLVGMETGLCLFMTFGLFVSYQRRDRWAPLWAALCYLSRPEGIIITIIIAVVLVVDAIRKRQFVERLKTYAPALGIAAGLVVAWHGWFYLIYHTLTSATANAKVLQGHAEGWTTFAQSWPLHLAIIYDPQDPLWINLLRVPVAAFGLVLIAWRCWPLIAWPVVHYAAFAALGVAYYHWYFYPIDFVAASGLIVGSAGVITLALKQVRQLNVRTGAIAGLIVAIPAAVFVLPNAKAAAMSTAGLKPSPAFTDGRYPAYAKLSNAMLEASGDKPITLLTHEIGIFGFLMPRADIRDVVGLATPLTNAKDLWNWDKPVAAFDPDYLLWPFPGAPSSKFFKDRDGRYVRYTTFDASGGYTLYRRIGPQTPEGEKFARAMDGIVALQSTAEASAAPLEPIDVDGEVVLFAHAPSSFVLTKPAEAAGVSLSFGYRPDAWAGDNQPDGSSFTVQNADTSAILFQRTLAPLQSEADRGIQTAVFAINSPRIRVSFDPLASSNWDWTFLGAPVWLDAKELAEKRLSAPASAGWDGKCPSAADVRTKIREGVGGRLDEVAQAGGNRINLRGWAADVANKQPGKMVVVMKGDKVVGCGMPYQPRPDVAAAEQAPVLATSGFLISIDGAFDREDGQSRLLVQTADNRYLNVGLR